MQRFHAGSDDPPPTAGGKQRRGAIAVLAAIMATFMIAFLAFSIDVGYLCMARSQAQHCADAAALAAALEMTSNENLKMDIQHRIAMASQTAHECASMQDINHTIQGDGATSVIEEVVFGRIENPDNPNEPFSLADPNNPNAVYVRVSCDPARGTAVPLFFARIFGMDTGTISASAVAAFPSDTTTGFVPEPEKRNTLMPFAVSEEDWQSFLAHGSEDDWTYDPVTKTVTPGPDGIPELKMFPDRKQGNWITPGNFGAIQIGDQGGGAQRLIDQIRNGPTPEDLASYEGKLAVDPVTGMVELVGVTSLDFDGETGINASIQHGLADVIGDPKTIMIYSDVEGPGANAVFTITRFAGIRVVDFNMTGAAQNKYILIQPAIVQDNAAVETPDSNASDNVGRPIRLVR